MKRDWRHPHSPFPNALPERSHPRHCLPAESLRIEGTRRKQCQKCTSEEREPFPEAFRKSEIRNPKFLIRLCVIDDGENRLRLFEGGDQVRAGGAVRGFPQHLHRSFVADPGGVGAGLFESRK